MHRLARWTPAALGLALAAGPTVRHEPRPEIAWRPALPLQGSLVVLVVRPVSPDSTLLVTGVLADEPLHFESDGRGGYVSLGGVPITATDSLPLQVRLGRSGSTGDTFAATLPVGPRGVAREALRTAPQFTRPPDSALAARLERERALITAVLARAHETPRLWSEPFTRPRASAIRSRFGLEREFNDVVESRHLGVDFAGPRGSLARASNRGVVTLVEELFYAGNTVYLDHGGGLLTAYMHLDRALVAVGDTVERGQVVGRVGATGRVTGPHLHWLARFGTILIDPLDLLTLELFPDSSGASAQRR
jgi:murein DD-endopeptidase MepM/ murein hydrolase activator NlpD